MASRKSFGRHFSGQGPHTEEPQDDCASLAPNCPYASAYLTPPPVSRWRQAGGQICGLFATDIVGFTNPRRDEHVQLYLRHALYRMMERAFDGAGIPWSGCLREDRGDGVLVVVPPHLLTALALTDPLPERLQGLIRVHNRVSGDDARIQLRAAAHVGTVYRDEYGFAGDAVNLLFRLLNASQFKRLLATSPAELAFIASDHLYESVIRRHSTLVDPAAFRPVAVSVKPPAARGWVHLLGGEPGIGSVLPFGRSA